MDPQPPSDADLQRLFDSPGDVPVGSFEIALVLGGTVSSGAYTAGVLDFLVEALDAWVKLRDAGGAVHQIIKCPCGSLQAPPGAA